MAVFYMFCASACFVSMSALVKALAGDLPLPELMFFRSVITLPLLVGILLYRGRPLLTTNLPLLLLRTLFGGLAMFGFYFALSTIPLADCVFIGRTQPIILALLAPALVQERADRMVWLAILLGLAGSLLVMAPDGQVHPGSVVAFLAALFSALAHLMVRLLGRSNDPDVIVFNFTFLLALLSGAGSLPAFTMPSTRHWPLLFGISLFATGGQYLMTLAYSLEKAPKIAAASYSSVFLSILYGWFFWQETVSPVKLTGGLCIVCGGYLLIRSGKGG